MRLTVKNGEGLIVESSFEYSLQNKVCYADCIHKLGQLEDIEKELGINLVVYHKLMDILYCGEPNILYVKDKGVIIQVSVLEIDYCKKKIIFYKDNLHNYNADYVYGFFQYGKTWALTKEELEGDR